MKWKKVVLAHAIERDIPEDNHLIMSDFKANLEVLGGVYPSAGKDLFVHVGDPSRSVQETVTVRILANRAQQLFDGGLDSLVVDGTALLLGDSPENL